MAKAPVEGRQLNVEQKKAVKHGEGPLLIIAGAGTGKTTVITERIKYLVSSELARPEEILALTFTEKAAREMEERVDQAMPYGYTQMWISTFHSFCDRILRAEALQIGLNPGYKLLREAEATMLLRSHLFLWDLEYFRPLGNPQKFISGMLQHFSRLKDEDVTEAQYFEWVKALRKSFDSPSTSLRISAQDNNSSSDEELLEIKKYQELANAYKAYEQLKIKESRMDFGDLISNTLLLFRRRPNILKKYQEQFKFILVDEFQDTNVAQNELVKLLAGKKQNITVVGDDDQAVYKFRGAAVSNMIQFRKNFPKTKIVVLTKNYRSTQSILDSAYKLIQNNNPDRLEIKENIKKKLSSSRHETGIDPKFIHADRVENEAEAVAREIKKFTTVISNEVRDLATEGSAALDFSGRIPRNDNNNQAYSFRDFAILVRANNHAEAFIRSLQRHGIPHQFLGPGQLLKQPEIKELIAYLQVLNNFEDNIAFLKLLSMEYFGLPAKDITLIANMAKRYGFSLFETCEFIIGTRQVVNIKLPVITDTAKKTLSLLISMIERHLKLTRKETAGQLLFYFLQDSGMLPKILEYKFPIDEKKAQNITRFFNKLKTYEAEHEEATVERVLDWLMVSLELGESPLSSDSDWTENDAVNILTVHSSKGLEFPVVFLVNLVHLRFPVTERSEQIPIPVELIKEELPEGDFHIQEERRLFYVGMTRAKDLLYLTSANYYGEGKREKKVSPFVYESLGENTHATKHMTDDQQLSLLDWKKAEPKRPDPSADGEGTLPKTPVSYLSYSQIDTFRTCPLHYKLKYLFKIPSPPSPSLSFGTTMHLTLKNIYEAVQKREPINLEKALGIYSQNWIREGYQNKEYEAQMKVRGEKYLHEYFVSEFDPEAKVVQLEQQFVVPIDSHNRKLKIGGKIDRVDDLGEGRIEIIDYKTGRLPTKRELDANLQLSMYALAASLIPYPPFHKKVEDVQLSLYFFETREKITFQKTARDLENAKNLIMSIADEITQSDFTCSRGRLCLHCEYQMFCEQRG